MVDIGSLLGVGPIAGMRLAVFRGPAAGDSSIRTATHWTAECLVSGTRSEFGGAARARPRPAGSAWFESAAARPFRFDRKTARRVPAGHRPALAPTRNRREVLPLQPRAL